MLSRPVVPAVLALLLTAFVGFALASPPVPPPKEGFVVGTTADINCIGDVTEKQEFTWTYVSNDFLNAFSDAVPPDIFELFTRLFGWQSSSVDPLYLGDFESGAQIRYDEELRAVDSGAFQLNNSFTAESHDEPNLEVAKDYSWTGMEGSGITNVENRERVGLSIVSNGEMSVTVIVGWDGEGAIFDVPAGLSDMPSICPWAQDNFVPATNEFIAMGSRTTATGADGNMVSTTRTDVTSTGPPSLGHTTYAQGLGTAEAEMSAV